MRSTAIRDELTGEWKNRGIKEHKDYAILTAEISKARFGMTPAEYKQLKGLNRQSLRDHMTDLELIFSMLGVPGHASRNLGADSGDEREVAGKSLQDQ